jgi:hypothetical protein
MRWRRRRSDPRARLADDVRRLAGYAESVVAHADRLDVEVPEELADCVVMWWRWSRDLKRSP